MKRNAKRYSFLFGRFVITSNALTRLNLLDVYWALFRHALHKAVEFCPLHYPGRRGVVWIRCRYATAHLDRHCTAFWIVTEADLSRTTIQLANEM